MIFFRSVSFSELESLVSYIYTGSASVPGASVQAFLALCHSLGVTGFTELGDNKENQESCVRVRVSGAAVTPKKSSSVPLALDEAGAGPVHKHQGSASKKRKLFTQSLGINYTCVLFMILHTVHSR